MAQRMIRDFTDSEKVNALSYMAEVFLNRLFQKADDYGFFHANPKLLKSFLFPLKEDITFEQIASYLTECEINSLLYTYEVEGKKYLQIYNFGQRLRNMKSKFPQPADSCRQHADKCPPEEKIEEEENSKIEEEEEGEIESIISFLNEITFSSFKKESDKNKKPIRARLREKFTVEDFREVIKFKYSQWGLDPKMKEYLRPETLFGNKFEGYLNAARAPAVVRVATSKIQKGLNDIKEGKELIKNIINGNSQNREQSA